ncbi:hypothetical protein HDU88_004236 [Geranomyces variabilis]|nr:hypothetical protein HDU88_004236 [Geranomyces variabilis]
MPGRLKTEWSRIPESQAQWFRLLVPIAAANNSYFSSSPTTSSSAHPQMPNGTVTWSISGERTVAIAGKNLEVSLNPTKLSISGENLHLSEITGGVDTRPWPQSIFQTDADNGFNAWKMLSLAFTLALVAYFFTKVEIVAALIVPVGEGLVAWIGKTKALPSTVEVTKEITDEQPVETQLTEPDAKTAGLAEKIMRQTRALVSLQQEVDRDTARFLRDVEKEAPELLSRAQDYLRLVGRLAQSFRQAVVIILSSCLEISEVQKLADYEERKRKERTGEAVALEQLAPAIAARAEELRAKTCRLIDHGCDLCKSAWNLVEEWKDE